MWFWSFWIGWGASHIIDAYLDYGPPEGPFGGGGGSAWETTCHQMTAGSQHCH